MSAYSKQKKIKIFQKMIVVRKNIPFTMKIKLLFFSLWIVHLQNDVFPFSDKRIIFLFEFWTKNWWILSQKILKNRTKTKESNIHFFAWNSKQKQLWFRSLSWRFNPTEILQSKVHHGQLHIQPKTYNNYKFLIQFKTIRHSPIPRSS